MSCVMEGRYFHLVHLNVDFFYLQNPDDNTTLNTYVVSASVSNVNVSNLHQPVIVTLRHLKPVQVCE